MISDLHSRLSAPFPPDEIEWRVGSTNAAKTSGLALAYLTARHVMDRLDQVVGTENWQDRYEVHGSKTICYLSIRIGGEWITKADGAGDTDVEAEKGSLSDALKRAAVKWGIGRYLYDLGNVWVEVEPAGKSVRIKQSEYAKLERTLAQRFGVAVPQASKPAPKPFDPDAERLEHAVKLIAQARTAEDLRDLLTTELVKKAIGIGPEAKQRITEAKDKRKAELSADVLLAG